MANSIRIGSIKKIDIEINYNWIIIFLLITFMFSNFYFPLYFPDWPDFLYWIEGAVLAIMLFVSVLLHELSHSMVSMHYGIPVTKISLFIFGGLAYIEKEADSPKKEFFIAIAGPLMSVFLFGVFTLTGSLLQSAGVTDIVTAPLLFIGQMNIVLAIFNLFPALPLDGGRILTAIIWAIKKDRVYATRVAGSSGTIFSYGLMMLGILNILSGNLIGGIWLIFIGIFIGQSSQSSYQNALLEKLFNNLTVRDIMTSPVLTVDLHMSVSDVLRDFFYHYKHPFFPVEDDGMIVGAIMLKSLKSVNEKGMEDILVQQVYEPLDKRFIISPDEPAQNALRMMASNELGRFMVMENNILIGILSKTDLIKYISIYNELHS